MFIDTCTQLSFHDGKCTNTGMIIPLNTSTFSTYTRRWGKKPWLGWSRDSFRNPLLYGVGKVSNYMLPHTSDALQMQAVRSNSYERQHKPFDLKLSIFVCFMCYISFILVSV